MIKKEEVISFVWQHVLLLVSLYVMTFGVAAMCAKSVRFKRYFHHPLRDGFGRKDA